VAVTPAGYGDGEARLGLIGVAFVERADGRAALAHGCELARAAGALVRVLTVREPEDWRFTGPLEPAQLVAADRARDDAGERTLQAGLDAVPESRSAGGELLVGPPEDALAAVSADLDLLVCGSRGHGPLRTLLLGSVSHALVRQAACPVLAVPLADPDESGTVVGSRIAAA
jgi:nucleotide-binding universal stress UspA family protein